LRLQNRNKFVLPALVTKKNGSEQQIVVERLLGVYHVFEYYLACRTTAVELPYRQHWNDRVVRDILTAT